MGRLARKLPFHIFKSLFFEGGLAGNGGFHCVNFHFLRKVSCEMRFERWRMHGMLRFAAQNVPRKMEGRSAARQVPDSLCSGESFWNRPHNGTDGSGVIWITSTFSFCGMSSTKRCFHIFNFQLWR